MTTLALFLLVLLVILFRHAYQIRHVVALALGATEQQLIRAASLMLRHLPSVEHTAKQKEAIFVIRLRFKNRMDLDDEMDASERKQG